MKTFKKIYQFLFVRHRKVSVAIFALLFIGYIFILPKPLFTDPTCMVLEDRQGELLGARIAADGQWRFPYSDYVPEKFAKCITTFEDKRFYRHWGVDPRGIGRAIKQNLQNRRVVSGGSTLTMQVMRMSRKGKARSVYQKLVEAILATRLEWRHSKAEILALYASNAPFGGNVVGLDAASWRYYSKGPKFLTWGEAATLAVLPNSPALIHPGRNRTALLEKRNRLLDKLVEQAHIDVQTAALAKEEPLPDKPHPLPRLAPHLLDRAYKEHFYQKKNLLTRLQTTVDKSLQRKLNQLIKKNHRLLLNNDIHNLAAMIVEIESGNVLAYVGNVIDAGEEHGQAVDVIPAARSTGSILKPFLTALSIQEGLMLPDAILSDVPTQMKGYRPENFYETYDGVVPLQRALTRSLNVPFVRLVQRYGLEKFHSDLKELGMTTLSKPPSHYGLPLVLGGAEGSLWDITGVYTSMSRTLGRFYAYDGRYNLNDFRALNYI